MLDAGSITIESRGAPDRIRASFFIQISGSPKLSAVRRVGMHAKPRLLTQFQDSREWIDRSWRSPIVATTVPTHQSNDLPQVRKMNQAARIAMHRHKRECRTQRAVGACNGPDRWPESLPGASCLQPTALQSWTIGRRRIKGGCPSTNISAIRQPLLSPSAEVRCVRPSSAYCGIDPLRQRLTPAAPIGCGGSTSARHYKAMFAK